MYTFIQQGGITLIKSDSIGIYNVTKIILFQINAVLLNFLWKNSNKIFITQKNIKQHKYFEYYK